MCELCFRALLPLLLLLAAAFADGVDVGGGEAVVLPPLLPLFCYIYCYFWFTLFFCYTHTHFHICTKRQKLYLFIRSFRNSFTMRYVYSQFFFFARKRDRESLLNRKSYKFGWETKSVWGFLMNYPFVGELVKEWRSVSYPFNIVFSTYIYIYRIRCRKVHIFMLWGGCGRTWVLVYACKRSLSFVFILFFSSVEHIHADTHIAQCASFLSQPLLLFYFNFYSLFLPL